MIVRKFRNANNFGKCLYSNSSFFENTNLIISKKGCKRIVVTFRLIIRGQTPFLHRCPDRPGMVELFVGWAHFDLGTRVSPNQLV